MKKITTFLFFITGVVIFSYASASAEVIKSFYSEARVNLDSSVSVTETIVYDSEGLERRGIFRDIRPFSSTGEEMVIKDISVRGEYMEPLMWRREMDGENIRIRIGDPDVTFRGEKIYVISYTATNAISIGEKGDEIYWNITGDTWPFAIREVIGRVELPSSITERNDVCYLGMRGSTDQVCNKIPNGFVSGRELNPGEGMTIAVGFPSGIVQEYVPTLQEKIVKFLSVWWPFLIPIITFIVMYRKWDKKGRDPKRHKTIVNQSTLPPAITPIHMGIMLRSKMKPSDMSAELIYLAIKGYIKINEVTVKGRIFSRKDYQLTLLKDINEIDEAPHNILLLRILFEGVTTVSLSSAKFKKEIYSLLIDVETTAIGELSKKGYYINSPKDLKGREYGLLLFISFIFVMGSLVQLEIFSVEVYSFIFVACVLAFIIYFIFNKIMPARSVEGNDLYNYILGLKKYIQVAEKERIAFHNDPKKGIDVFEKLLPFAMILGLEKKWSKEFKNVYTQNPHWYSTPNNNQLFLVHQLSGFSAFSSKSFSPILADGKGAGGISGGGFSGGGGGGGGGGSW